MLTPYEVFQTYAIFLWIYEEYYIFSVLLLVYSLYTYWASSWEVVNNQRKLAQNSYFNTVCKVVSRRRADGQGSELESDHNDSEEHTISEEINSQGDEAQEKKQFQLSE